MAMMGGLEAQTCMMPGGFQSYAPAFITDGCVPGTIVAGCKAVRRYTATIAAGGTDEVDLDPFQPLKVGAIVSIGAASDITLDEWEVDGQSLFPKVKNATGQAVDGLGPIDALTPELYRSGLNPLPPQPAIDKVDPGTIFLSSTAGGTYDLLVYYVNPPT